MDCFKNCCSGDASTIDNKQINITKYDTNNITEDNINDYSFSALLDNNNNINNSMNEDENDNEINIKLNELKREKRLLQRSIENMQEKLDAVKKVYNNQLAELERKKTDLEFAQNQLAIIQNKIKSVPKDYKTQIAELEQKNTDLDKQILEHQNEIQEQNNNINQNNNALSQLNKQIALGRKKYLNSRRNFRIGYLDIKISEEKEEEIQCRMELAKKLHEMTMNKYNKSQMEKEESLRLLQQEWDKKKNEIQEFEKKIVEITKNMKKLTNTENELKNNIKALNEKKLQVEQEANDIKNTINLDKEIKSSLLMLQKQNNELEESIIERQKNIEQLKEDCQNYEKENQQLVRKNNYFKCKQYEGGRVLLRELKGQPFYEQQHGKEKKKIIFLDKNGQQLTDINTINKNINEQNFNSVALYKKNSEKAYTKINTESDINNNSEIFLAHQLSQHTF